MQTHSVCVFECAINLFFVDYPLVIENSKRRIKKVLCAGFVESIDNNSNNWAAGFFLAYNLAELIVSFSAQTNFGRRHLRTGRNL